MMNSIRVMLVEDSLFIRRLIKVCVDGSDDMKVVAEASDPFEAVAIIKEAAPDVLVCDIEMPRMNGLNFIHQLLPQYPVPVVIFSTLSDRIFDAFSAGAVDFLAKPVLTSETQTSEFIKNELLPRIRGALGAKVIPGDRLMPEAVIKRKPLKEKKTIIAIGASTGGTEAISRVIKGFEADVPGIIVAQHIPPVFSAMFAERLNRESNLVCREAKTGDEVRAGEVLIAPGDKHMRLTNFNGKMIVDCNSGEKINGFRPSVDILFDSVAKTAGRNAIGIILTGLGKDGAKGLLNMKMAGAETIGQDEESSIVYGMPREAYEIGAVKYQLPLDSIPAKTYALLKSMN